MSKQQREDPAVRFDAGKLRYELVAPEMLEGLAQVMTYGAGKYGERNWEQGMTHDRMMGSAFRHIESYRKGELLDDESNLEHLSHAAWNLLALLTYHKRGL